jgi:hypothetical protein
MALIHGVQRKFIDNAWRFQLARTFAALTAVIVIQILRMSICRLGAMEMAAFATA